MKTGPIRLLACLGLGSMLGFVAANKDFTPGSRADDAPTSRRIKAEAEDSNALPSCGPQGVNKASLLALASAPGAAASRPRGAAPGRKPNIVVILSDDTGWGDLGAYGGGSGVARRRPSSIGWPARACSSCRSTASRAARPAGRP